MEEGPEDNGLEEDEEDGVDVDDEFEDIEEDFGAKTLNYVHCWVIELLLKYICLYFKFSGQNLLTQKFLDVSGL
jgi:hypothetical protein